MPCASEGWHWTHLLAPGYLCRGKGLGAICEHGVQMLDACSECETAYDVPA